MLNNFLSSSPLTNTGQTGFLPATGRDAEFEKASPEKVRASERRYRHFFESGKDGILILDANSRKIIEANRLMTELLGYSREEFIGKELWEFGLLQDEQASKTAFRELQERNFIRYEDLPLQTKDGSPIQVEFVSNRYCEDDRFIIRCNIRDVTERKQMQRELAEKARLLDLSDDAIIVRDLQDNISLWNKGAEKLYGWTYEEVRGKNLHSLLQTEFPKPIDEIVAQLHQEGQFSGEVVQVARNGRHVPCLCRWVLDPSSESILTSYTDITDRKVAEEALEKVAEERMEAVKTLESLSYTMAHDLRAPIRAISGFIEALTQDVQMGDVAKDYAQRIQQAAERMGHMVDDLLKFSRLNHQRIPSVPVNLNTLIEGILGELVVQIQTTKAEIQVRAPLPLVSGNPTLVEQVLSNLISNALKFVPRGITPKLLLHAETRGSMVRLWVEDNGIGIEPKHQAKIFDVFQRLHTTDQFPGTGVGLAIIKRALERMGGEVGVESELGKGSKFWVELPKAQASSEKIS